MLQSGRSLSRHRSAHPDLRRPGKPGTGTIVVLTAWHRHTPLDREELEARTPDQAGVIRGSSSSAGLTAGILASESECMPGPPRGGATRITPAPNRMVIVTGVPMNRRSAEG